MRGNRKAMVGMQVAIVVVIVVVIVAAVGIMFTKTLPDANDRPANGVGYFDTKATLYWGQYTGCDYTGGSGVCEVSPYALASKLGDTSYNPKVVFDEHSNLPSSPATVFQPPSIATGVETTCSSWARMTVTGPGLSDFDPKPKESDHVTFTIGNAVSYRWGHFYMTQTGSFDVKIELYVATCYG